MLKCMQIYVKKKVNKNIAEKNLKKEETDRYLNNSNTYITTLNNT